MERLADANRLKQLYDERVPRGMSQAEFGATFEIGSQSMVSQYLSGHRPLNFEAIAKFAKGLRCTIADISPTMARQIKYELFPLLGRVAVKAALALLVLPPYFVLQIPVCVLCKMVFGACAFPHRHSGNQTLG